MVGGTAVIPGRPACQALHPCPAPGHLLPGKNFRWPGGSLTSDQWHRAPRALRGTLWTAPHTAGSEHIKLGKLEQHLQERPIPSIPAPKRGGRGTALGPASLPGTA